MLKFSYFNTNILNPLLAHKFLVKNVYELPSLKVIYLSIFIPEIIEKDDINVLDALEILEILSLQKPIIKKYNIGFSGKQKKISIFLKVSLRRYKLNNFINIFHFCYTLYYSRINRSFNTFKTYLKNNKEYFVIINDLSFFYFIKEHYLDFNYKIRISFVLNNSKNYSISDYFNFLDVHMNNTNEIR